MRGLHERRVAAALLFVSVACLAQPAAAPAPAPAAMAADELPALLAEATKVFAASLGKGNGQYLFDTSNPLERRRCVSHANRKTAVGENPWPAAWRDKLPDWLAPWEKVAGRLRFCHYDFDSADIRAVPTTVLLLDINDVLPRWVALACAEAVRVARGRKLALDGKRCVSNALSGTSTWKRSLWLASGAQFPVAGIVVERMEGKPVQAMCFRHGITVQTRKFGAEPTYSNEKNWNAAAAAVDDCFLQEDAPKPMAFARPISTCAREYYAYLKLSDPNEKRDAWERADLIRDLTLAALADGAPNPLVNATVLGQAVLAPGKNGC
jgi:hypothetical protein